MIRTTVKSIILNIFEIFSADPSFHELASSLPILRYFGNLALETRTILVQIDKDVQNLPKTEFEIEKIQGRISDFTDMLLFLSDVVSLCPDKVRSAIEMCMLNIVYLPLVVRSLVSNQTKATDE